MPMPSLPPGHTVTPFNTVGGKRRWVAGFGDEMCGAVRKSERSAIHDAVKHAATGEFSK